MLKRLVVLVLAGVMLSCAGEAPEETVTEAPKIGWYPEGANVLSLLKGVTVLDRSGERSFDNAATFAIDGHPTTAWAAPPYDLKQWILFELPVRTRIEALGLDNGTFIKMPTLVKELGLEFSLDGRDWSSVGTMDFEIKKGRQLQSVQPFEAKFLRVTMFSNHGDNLTTYLPTLLAEGEELEPWSRPNVTGRWMLNDVVGEFHEKGSRVFGRIALDPPMVIDGAWDGRIIRFTWVRGRSYGVGLISLSPEGGTLNGIWWYENQIDSGNGLGTPWFGTKVGPAETFEVATQALAQLWIERDGRFPLYGLVFDAKGALDVEASRPALEFLQLAITSFPQYRIRLEVSEFHSIDGPTNLEASRKRAAALEEGLRAAGLPVDRFVIAAIGSERPYPSRTAPVQWTLYSRVDFSLTAIE